MNLPSEITQEIFGRMTPFSLEKIACVNRESNLMVQSIARGRLYRSFNGPQTSLRPSNELLRRSVRWPTMISKQAFAKLGKITAALQTQHFCVLALESTFIANVKEMIVLDPPKWLAFFPLQNRVEKILSFEEGDVIAVTEDKIEKYRAGVGKIAEVDLSSREKIVPSVGEKIPFFLIYNVIGRVCFFKKTNFEMIHSFQSFSQPKSLFHFGGKYVLLFEDGSISEVEIFEDCITVSKPVLNSLSCLQHFQCASSNFQELYFTIENKNGSTLYLIDRHFQILSQVSKRVRFEKMVRIQEYILGLSNNCIYAESIIDFFITSVFVPENGLIIDFCPSEEGIVRVLIQQPGRIVMTHLRFFPYKELRMDR